MEESAPVESQGQLPSPHHGSLRRAVAAVLALDGESTLGRRKKRRKDSRPESIIIYRSDNEKTDEEPEESEGGDRPKEEEGEDFLDYPGDDGEFFRSTLFKIIGRKRKQHPPSSCWAPAFWPFLSDDAYLEGLLSSLIKLTTVT